MNPDELRSKLPHLLLLTCVLTTAAITIFFIAFIFKTALPVFESEGLGFITGTKWSYTEQVYGIRIFIIGTLVMTAVTLALAVPVSVFTAIFLSEFAPVRVAGIMRPMVELLVGIPSVVYGIFGLFVLEDIFQDKIDPFLSGTLGLFIPFFSDPSPNSGTGVLLASTILAVMILPTIIALSEDAMRAVPFEYKEASFALGATHWETIRKVVLPTASGGILAATVLGMMRAMGETMAIVGTARKSRHRLWIPGMR
jgi:phosphate transport system permease protein